jgi:hemin uptake protein HemP
MKPASPHVPQPPPQAATIRSADLLRQSKVVWIAHGGAWYRLAETRNGKLILTK